MSWVVGIDHVQLAMPPGGEEQAIAFYADALGLRQQPKPPALAGRGGCWFESRSAKIHLGVEADFRPARKAHPALVVRDLAGVAAALSAAGHSTVPGEQIDGVARIYVDDPFGNRIELVQLADPPR